MKKVLSFIIALMMITAACAFAETASPAEPLEEGEIYVHGYASSATGYYVAVPAEWALIGRDSHPENLSQAYDIMGYASVNDLVKQLSDENDVLFAVSADGKQMALTYGSSDGITCDRLVEEIDAFKAMLQATYPGIEFKEDSGTVTINELTQVMYIGAKYKSHDVSQYFFPMGSYIYVFTFTDVGTELEKTVLSTFTISR